MNEKRWVVAYGEDQKREVYRAPETEPGDFLTRTEAANRIIDEMNGTIARAQDTKRRAKRILRAEQKKGFTS